jgi:hypothetical protein
VNEAHLNWSGAKVDDGRLVVELEGELPSGWKKNFANTVTLLGGGEWGKVELKKRTVTVSDVAEGAEEKLRHFLESLIQQANAAHPPASPESDDAESHAQAADDDGPDELMTERFRSFSDKQD